MRTAAAATACLDTPSLRNQCSGKKGEKKAKSGGFGAPRATSLRLHGSSLLTLLLLPECMGLLPQLFNALRRKGYRLPTPVQRKAIPHIMAGKHGACSNPPVLVAHLPVVQQETT